MTTAEEIISVMTEMKDENQSKILSRFFKTGPGEYGEGDMFLGLKVPHTRSIVKEARHEVPFPEIEKLLQSRWHEIRLCGFLLLVEEMKKALPRRNEPPTTHAGRRAEIADFYIRHARYADNWDLVDLSAPYILGEWLIHPLADASMPSRDILDRLALSDNLWEQRISVVTTLRLIRDNQFADTERIVTRLLSHPHDLIHKACGWMLREIGKRDIETLRSYLDRHAGKLPRTTLRYAIERMNPEERQYRMRK